ncbi:LuxR C-terminal-related transcriptional regulator [Streptomyces sp. O3]
MPKEIAEATGLSQDEARRVARELLDLHLLTPIPGDPDAFVPVAPDAAAATLVGPEEQRLRELQRSISETRNGLLALLPAYFESRRRRNRVEAFDIITDLSVLRALIDDCGTRCRHTVLSVQPGSSRPPGTLVDARRRTLERLERGIHVEHLYQHTARGDLVTSAYVRDMTAAGAEIRTTDQVIDRMIIFDREVVFLPEQDVVGRVPGAIVVREPTLVAFLCKLYDHLWANATVFDPDAEEPADVTDDVKRSIIKLMSQGYKDEMVARRMGMSVRTCRRHISELMDELGADSRFQAGVNAALSGTLDEAADPEDPRP